MKDILLFLLLFIIGYICFISVALVIGKMIFPFFTKEQLQKRNVLIGLKR